MSERPVIPSLWALALRVLPVLFLSASLIMQQITISNLRRQRDEMLSTLIKQDEAIKLQGRTIDHQSEAVEAARVQIAESSRLIHVCSQARGAK